MEAGSAQYGILLACGLPRWPSTGVSSMWPSTAPLPRSQPRVTDERFENLRRDIDVVHREQEDLLFSVSAAPRRSPFILCFSDVFSVSPRRHRAVSRQRLPNQHRLRHGLPLRKRHMSRRPGSESIGQHVLVDTDCGPCYACTASVCRPGLNTLPNSPSCSSTCKSV